MTNQTLREVLTQGDRLTGDYVFAQYAPKECNFLVPLDVPAMLVTIGRERPPDDYYPVVSVDSWNKDMEYCFRDFKSAWLVSNGHFPDDGTWDSQALINAWNLELPRLLAIQAKSVVGGGIWRSLRQSWFEEYPAPSVYTFGPKSIACDYIEVFRTDYVKGVRWSTVKIAQIVADMNPAIKRSFLYHLNAGVGADRRRKAQPTSE